VKEGGRRIKIRKSILTEQVHFEKRKILHQKTSKKFAARR